MRVAIVLLMLVPALPALAVTVRSPYPAPEAQSRVTQAMALQGIEITNSDGANGIVQGKGSFLGKPGLFTCPKANGVAEKQDFEVNVVVRGLPDGGSDAEIVARGTEQRYQNKKLVFITTGRERSTQECQSAGTIEAAIRRSLEGPAP